MGQTTVAGSGMEWDGEHWGRNYGGRRWSLRWPWLFRGHHRDSGAAAGSPAGKSKGAARRCPSPSLAARRRVAAWTATRSLRRQLQRLTQVVQGHRRVFPHGGQNPLAMFRQLRLRPRLAPTWLQRPRLAPQHLPVIFRPSRHGVFFPRLLRLQSIIHHHPHPQITRQCRRHRLPPP